MPVCGTIFGTQITSARGVTAAQVYPVIEKMNTEQLRNLARWAKGELTAQPPETVGLLVQA